MISVPKSVCDMHNLNEGDYLEISPIGYGEFKIKKVSE